MCPLLCQYTLQIICRYETFTNRERASLETTGTYLCACQRLWHLLLKEWFKLNLWEMLKFAVAAIQKDMAVTRVCTRVV